MNILFGQRAVCQVCKRYLSSTRLYERLGIGSNATQAEIKEAYIKLSKLYHPDARTPQSSSEKFAELNAAYEVLGRPEQRRRYDSENLWRESAASGGFAHQRHQQQQPGERRGAGPMDFDQRLRHEAEWMHMAAARQGRRGSAGAGADPSGGGGEPGMSDFKLKVLAALVGIATLGVAIRLLVVSMIQSGRHKREQAEYEVALSLLRSADTPQEALTAQIEQLLRQSRRGRRQRQADADALHAAEAAAAAAAASRGGAGMAGRPRTVSEGHAESRHRRRLDNFRRLAADWSAETRAALRPRLSPELAAELDRIGTSAEKAERVATETRSSSG